RAIIEITQTFDDIDRGECITFLHCLSILIYDIRVRILPTVDVLERDFTDTLRKCLLHAGLMRGAARIGAVSLGILHFVGSFADLISCASAPWISEVPEKLCRDRMNRWPP